MSRSKDNRSSRNNNSSEISNDLAREFLELQKVSLENKALELKFEDKRIQLERERMKHNAELAHKSLDYQREHLNAQIPEQRKRITVYLVFGLLVLLIVFGFMWGCIYLGKEDMALKVFLGLAAIVTHYITYRFGQSKGESEALKQRDPLPVEDAEVIED